ncbi:lysine-specific demethylase 6B-like [Phalacrocorax carbo]|uniref:lysine-specific demethylase 6B-like n=1 Tax=Phalacrocorax carbo TaxID=9209 RepID=UPI003119B369
MHRAVEPLGGRAGRDPFAVGSLGCGGAWAACPPRPWLPGTRCSSSIGQAQLPPHLAPPPSGNGVPPHKPYFPPGAPPRAPPGTLESLQGCVRALQPQPWEQPGPMGEAPPDLEEPPSCFHSPARCHRGPRGDIARIGRLQQAQLWSFPSGPASPPRARALPPLQQVWSLLHAEKRNFSAKRGAQLKRGAPPPDPPVVQPVPPAHPPPPPPDDLPSPLKRRRSGSPEQGGGGGQPPPGAPPGPPPFPLPQGLWNPLSGDAWTPPPRLGAPPDRQEQRSLVAHPFPPPPARLRGPPAAAPPPAAGAPRPGPRPPPK